MNSKNIITTALVAGFTVSISVFGCATPKMIADKSGAQLWGENCIRCHNLPAPTDFTDVQWATIGLHMEDKVNLTKAESDKIVDFLKSAN